MEPLKKLKATYGSEDINNLVDFTRRAPIELPESKTYRFEKVGSVIHIYGEDSGINQYNIADLSEGMSLKGIKTTPQAIEINLSFEGIEKILLHTKPYKWTKVGRRKTSSVSSLVSSISSCLSGESRSSGESAGINGESRGSGSSGESSSSSGESRRPSSSGESSGSSGESR
ncbi:MAG: hypothetical protein ABIB71_03775 [Candidatus Woesearchaeota archaeon]